MVASNEVVYFMYAELLETGHMAIKTSEINRSTWQDHYDGIMNLMKDHIETEQLQSSFVTVDFGNGDIVELSVIDLYINLIMWYPLVSLNIPITGEHLYFNECETQDTIKNFFDKYIIERYRQYIDNTVLNNILDDAVHKLIETDAFGMYLANTINLKDTIELMQANPEFNNILHTSLANMPMEDVKEIGMQLTNRSIDIIKDAKKYIGHDHCLANSFRAQQGINIRQFKEFLLNIGSKPNGMGGVHPSIIDGSYVGGALNSILAQFIDSSASRVAQIQTKGNTGESGKFARVLGLNNIDSDIMQDPDYDCHTKNFIVIQIVDKKHFEELIDRYYRFDPDGIDHLITPKDTFLIGRIIYLRSPMTCASSARGHGVCHKCYGELAYTNRHIKVGKYAAEKLSAEITQRQLSAKHLLETIIKKLAWFIGWDRFLAVNMNIIQLSKEAIIKKNTFLIIDPESIDYVNEDDYDTDGDISTTDEYNEYITECRIETPEGESVIIGTENKDKLYLSNELKSYMTRFGKRTEDGLISIDLFHIYNENDEFSFFLLDLDNNELSKTLDDIRNLIDLKPVVQSHNKDSILQEMLRLVIEGKLHIMSVHLEMLLMDQIRDADNVLEKPDWSKKNAPYQLLTLNQSLLKNPSVTVTLLYQYLSKVLYNPLTFKKHAPSRLDLFFMKQPQQYLSNKSNIAETKPVNTGKTRVITKYRVPGEPDY